MRRQCFGGHGAAFHSGPDKMFSHLSLHRFFTTGSVTAFGGIILPSMPTGCFCFDLSCLSLSCLSLGCLRLSCFSLGCLSRSCLDRGRLNLNLLRRSSLLLFDYFWRRRGDPSFGDIFFVLCECSGTLLRSLLRRTESNEPKRRLPRRPIQNQTSQDSDFGR